MPHLFQTHFPARLSLAALAAVGLAALTPAAHAQTTIINVANSDFESPPLSTTVTQTDGNTPTGFTFNGGNVDTGENYATGVQNVAIAGKTGNQYGFIYGGSNGFNLGQDITANGLNAGFSTIAGDTYTLTADVNTAGGAYAVLRLSDGNGSSLSGPLRSDAGFTTYSTSFTATAGTASKDLVLDLFLTDASGAGGALNGQNVQANFDNVRLTQTSPVPEASSFVSLGLLLTLGGVVLFRRRRTSSSL